MASASEPSDDARARRAPRRAGVAGALAALLTLAAGVLAASCTTALGLDGQQSAPIALCTKLQDCYANGAPASCQARVDGSLAVAAASTRSTWLSSFSQDTCLDSCASARRCLDLQPVCSPHRASCETAEDCCDFVTGHSDCVGKKCCSARGVRCMDDDQCCSNAGYCDPPDVNHPGDKYCGAVVCRESGTACNLDAECCSQVCVNGACGLMICSENGFDCAADTDCCSGHCEADKRCGSTCAPVGGVCHGDGDCCGGAGVACYVPTGADSGFCSACKGAPVGVHCATDADCCAGLACDRTYFQCSMQCASPGAACMNDGECCSGSCVDQTCTQKCSEAYCAQDADCCSGKCLSATCVPLCATSGCTHDVCTEGAPLAASCFAQRDACVSAVCKLDGYCCCGAWDTLCITEAAGLAKVCGACP